MEAILVTITFPNGKKDTRAFKKVALAQQAAQSRLGLKPEIVNGVARAHGCEVTVEGVNILDLFPRLDTRPVNERCRDLIQRKVLVRKVGA